MNILLYMMLIDALEERSVGSYKKRMLCEALVGMLHSYFFVYGIYNRYF